jgi:SAM-dependent methyltransferase
MRHLPGHLGGNTRGVRRVAQPGGFASLTDATLLTASGAESIVQNMQAEHARSIWDRKYEQGLPSLEKPDPLFVSAFDRFVSNLFPGGGNALDLAGGLGRHALFLAQRRWSVTVVDISTVAIRMLTQKARQLDLAMDMIAIDAKEYLFPRDHFDLIVMFYHFDRDTVSGVLSTLKTGGLLICKSSVIWKPYEGAAPLNLRPLEGGEILSRLPGLQVLHHSERPVRDRGVVEYVGQKPSDGTTQLAQHDGELR